MTDFVDIDVDVDIMTSMVRAAGRPLSVSLLQSHFDPAGYRTVLQRAEGSRHTFVRGVETYADGIDTGELPGRLIRGPQHAPA